MYKSTISIGLGTINMLVATPCLLRLYWLLVLRHTSKVPQQALQATTTAQDPISLTQRPSRHNDDIVHVTNIAEFGLESLSNEEPAVLIQHCPGCNILFCLWILLAFLSLAVGLWRSFKTSDEVKGFTDTEYVVAVGGLIIVPVQNRHAYTCERKHSQSERYVNLPFSNPGSKLSL